MKKLSIGKVLVANTSTVLYTVPTGYIGNLVLVYINNSGSGTKTTSVHWNIASSSTQIDIVNQTSLTSKSFLQFSGSYIAMSEGDTISAISEAGSTINIILTVELERV
jgi:hypothetical protein